MEAQENERKTEDQNPKEEKKEMAPEQVVEVEEQKVEPPKQ